MIDLYGNIATYYIMTDADKTALSAHLKALRASLNKKAKAYFVAKMGVDSTNTYKLNSDSASFAYQALTTGSSSIA